MIEDQSADYEITNDVKKQYETAFAKFGVDKKSLFWPKGRQDIRFQTHLSAIDGVISANRKAFSLIDYGCGFSDLYSYIQRCAISVSKYIGVDILEDFLEISKHRFPENYYYERESFVETKEIHAEVVCAIGTFSMKYVPKWHDNYEFVLSEIDMLWKKTELYLSIDFMTDKVDYMQLNSFHVDPERIVSDLQHLLNPSRIKIVESNVAFEFLVQIWK